MSVRKLLDLTEKVALITGQIVAVDGGSSAV